ncbi:hypothetical protein GQX73_g10057 [Xylaria multiplex]|uniref:Integrase zinc-binding domain-containing protein n=1 Tax=Xylaria multiplex TaxID=323545 RepID=A0A7C8MLB3_9PEZI|nr:hypothetical protein GQX73_g10057 [Xylaria multiplex]
MSDQYFAKARQLWITNLQLFQGLRICRGSCVNPEDFEDLKGLRICKGSYVNPEDFEDLNIVCSDLNLQSENGPGVFLTPFPQLRAVVDKKQPFTTLPRLHDKCDDDNLYAGLKVSSFLEYYATYSENPDYLSLMLEETNWHLRYMQWDEGEQLLCHNDQHQWSADAMFDMIINYLLQNYIVFFNAQHNVCIQEDIIAIRLFPPPENSFPTAENDLRPRTDAANEPPNEPRHRPITGPQHLNRMDLQAIFEFLQFRADLPPNITQEWASRHFVVHEVGTAHQAMALLEVLDIPDLLAMVKKTHLDFGHATVGTLLREVSKRCWHPEITLLAQQVVAECPKCQLMKPPLNKLPDLQPIIPPPPLTRWAMDHTSLTASAVAVNLLVCVEYATAWVEAEVVPDAGFEATKPLLTRIGETFGYPKEWICDNAGAFTSYEAKDDVQKDDVSEDTVRGDAVPEDAVPEDAVLQRPKPNMETSAHLSALGIRRRRNSQPSIISSAAVTEEDEDSSDTDNERDDEGGGKGEERGKSANKHYDAVIPNLTPAQLSQNLQCFLENRPYALRVTRLINMLQLPQELPTIAAGRGNKDGDHDERADSVLGPRFSFRWMTPYLAVGPRRYKLDFLFHLFVNDVLVLPYLDSTCVLRPRFRLRRRRDLTRPFEPFISAVLISLAQSSVSLKKADGNNNAAKSNTDNLITTRLLFTNRDDDQNMHVYTAHISHALLNRFRCPNQPPTATTQPLLRLDHRRVPYEPQATFRGRLLAAISVTAIIEPNPEEEDPGCKKRASPLHSETVNFKRRRLSVPGVL